MHCDSRAAVAQCPASVSELILPALGRGGSPHFWRRALEEPETILVPCFSDGCCWCQRRQPFAIMAALDMVLVDSWGAAFATAIGQGEIAASSFP